MTPLKVEIKNYLHGALCTLWTVDTECSLQNDIHTMLQSFLTELGHTTAILPTSVSINTVLYARTLDPYSLHIRNNKEEMAAGKWLEENSERDLFLGIHSIFANTSTHTWIVTYWGIPTTQPELRRY